MKVWKRVRLDCATTLPPEKKVSRVNCSSKPQLGCETWPPLQKTNAQPLNCKMTLWGVGCFRVSEHGNRTAQFDLGAFIQQLRRAGCQAPWGDFRSSACAKSRTFCVNDVRGARVHQQPKPATLGLSLTGPFRASRLPLARTRSPQHLVASACVCAAPLVAQQANELKHVCRTRLRLPL